MAGNGIDVAPGSPLSRAFVLIGQISEDVTHLAAATIGENSTRNREVQALIHLVGHPGSTSSQLADQIGADRSTASRLVGRLVDDGLVRRKAVPADRRSAKLVPTDRARTRVAKFEAAVVGYLGTAGGPAAQIADLLDGVAGGTAADQDDAPPESVREMLDRMARAGVPFVEEVMRFAPEFGLSRGVDRFVISLIYDRGRVRPSEVGTALRLTSGGTTQLLDRMAGAGLISRHRPDSGADRRAVVVTCTPQGAEAAERMLVALQHWAGPMRRAFAQAAAFAGAAHRVA